MYLKKGICIKTYEKKMIFVDVLKVTDKKRAGSGSGSGSIPKCHGSRTLDGS
jgi:hypothetical protein